MRLKPATNKHRERTMKRKDLGILGRTASENGMKVKRNDKKQVDLKNRIGWVASLNPGTYRE